MINLVKITVIVVTLPRDLREKTMADKLIYIPNNDAQNYPFCRLQLVVETFGHST